MFTSTSGLLLGIATFVSTAISVVALIINVVAVVDCARKHAPAFTVFGKLTKNQWLAILAIALFLNIVFGTVVLPVLQFGIQALWRPILAGVPGGTGLSIIGILSLVASLVYLLDVRPGINEVLSNRNRW